MRQVSRNLCIDLTVLSGSPHSITNTDCTSIEICTAGLLCLHKNNNNQATLSRGETLNEEIQYRVPYLNTTIMETVGVLWLLLLLNCLSSPLLLCSLCCVSLMWCFCRRLTQSRGHNVLWVMFQSNIPWLWLGIVQRPTLGCWDKGGRISGRLFSNYVQFTIISGKNTVISLL